MSAAYQGQLAQRVRKVSILVSRATKVTRVTEEEKALQEGRAFRERRGKKAIKVMLAQGVIRVRRATRVTMALD